MENKTVAENAKKINQDILKNVNEDFVFLKDVQSNEDILKSGFTTIRINLDKKESKKQKGVFNYSISFILDDSLVLSLSSNNSKSNFTSAHYFVICAERNKDYKNQNTHSLKGYARLSKSTRDDGSEYVLAEFIVSKSNRFKVYLTDMQIKQIQLLQLPFKIWERPQSEDSLLDVSEQIFGE